MRRYSAAEISDIKCDYIEAELLYAKLDLRKSKFLLRQSIETYERTNLSSSRPDLTGIDCYLKSIDLYAQLLNETKSENPTVIIRELLDKSLDCIDKYDLGGGGGEERLGLIVNSFYSLAKFLDAQYQSICEYMESKAFEDHAELMRQFQIERSKTQTVEPEGQFHKLLDKQYKLDREDMNALLDSQEEYLCKAIRYYLTCLELSQGVVVDK